MGELQFQTRHAQRQTRGGGLLLAAVGALLVGVSTLIGGDVLFRLIWAAFVITGLTLAVIGSRGMGLTRTATGLRRDSPLHAAVIESLGNTRVCFDTREEHPGAVVVARSSTGSERRVPGFIHVPRRAAFGWMCRVPNELLVREPHGATPDARRWRPTGVVWEDDGDGVFLDQLAALLDGQPATPPVGQVDPIWVGHGDAEFRTRDAARRRWQRFPDRPVPFPLLAAGPAMLLLLAVPGSGAAAGLLMGGAVLVGMRQPGHHVHVGSHGLRAGRTRPAVSSDPRLGVLAGQHGGAMLGDWAQPGGPLPLPGLRSFEPAGVGNQLFVRYPNSPDPRLRLWRPTGVEWGGDGAAVAQYVMTAAHYLRAAQPQQPAHAVR